MKGENANNVLVATRKSAVSQGKDWIRNDYGNAFLRIEEIEHEISVMSNEQQAPDKVKDIEACLSEDISNRKKKVKKIHGTLRTTCMCLWKVKKMEQH